MRGLCSAAAGGALSRGFPSKATISELSMRTKGGCAAGAFKNALPACHIFGVMIKAELSGDKGLERSAGHQHVNRRTSRPDLDIENSYRVDSQTVQPRHQGLAKEVVSELDLRPPEQLVTAQFVVVAALSCRGAPAAAKCGG